MKFGLQVFSLATIVLIFSFAGSLSDDTPSKESMDSKIKITSLQKTSPIAVAEPTAMPLMATKNSVYNPRNSDGENLKIPKITARVATITLLNPGKQLLEFNPEKRHPIASITKLITSVIAADFVGFQKQVTLDENDIDQEGTMGDFKTGEIYTIGDLVKAMLITSSNDAAFAIAKFYGYKNFMDAMRDKISWLGMESTTVYDPTGLSQLNQSTAYDLQTLALHLIKKYPHLLELSHDKETEISEIKTGTKKVIKNINKFAGNLDFLGGKTGYTDEAGGNLLSIFDYEGNKILIIVLGADDRFGETEALYEWAKKVLSK